MQSGELVSVIVPIYNVEQYLPQCLDSIIGQTYRNLEIILIDDGSTDTGGHIADEYAQKDGRITVFHKRNEGLSEARNCGLCRASGEYICFVDSDDVIHAGYIEKLYGSLKEYKGDVAICRFTGFDETHSPNYQQSDKIKVFSHDALMKKSFGGLFIRAWNKMYRRMLFDGIEFPKGKIHEDMFTTYRVLDKADKAVFVKSELYGYRERQGSITRQYTRKRLDELEGKEEQIVYFKGQGKRELVCRALATYIGCLDRHIRWSIESNTGEDVADSLRNRKKVALLELKGLSIRWYLYARAVSELKKHQGLYLFLKERLCS